MKRTCLACMLGFLGCGTMAFAGASVNMQEGLWEISTTADMPGIIMPPTVHKQCIRKNDLVPQNHQPGQECTVADVSKKGDRVMWTVHCDTPGGKMEGKGTITYMGSTFSGDVQMIINDRQEMHMNTHMKGRRIGDCP